MQLPTIIQGGMGVAISDWNLARAVSMEGQLGVVSSAGIPLIMTARLMNGDLGGHVRRALNHFPFQEPVQRLLETYFVPQPKSPPSPYKRPPMWTLNPPRVLDELTVISNFVEVFLAKEGHRNPVGINLLEKIQMPTMASLYGAMLAGVNFVIMGAGIPVQVPGILDRLTKHQAVNYRIDVQGSTPADEYHMQFDPKSIFTNAIEKLRGLSRPKFLPIVSSVVLAKSLIKRSTGRVDGFVVEGHIAGGHNAPPRGAMQLNEKGEPIYGPRDEIDMAKIKALGLPFWLAGGYDSPEKLGEAQAVGATGVQVGTAFAFCDESGMDTSLKRQVIQQVVDENAKVITDSLVSPTDYPFKVVQLDGTLSDPVVYEARERVCDLGLLREPYQGEDGEVGYRCPAEPESNYLAKGGKQEKLTSRGCLCNNLCATAGFAQNRQNGRVEPPLVTSGKGLPAIGRFFKPGRRSYSVRDVLDYVMQRKI